MVETRRKENKERTTFF